MDTVRQPPLRGSSGPSWVWLPGLDGLDGEHWAPLRAVLPAELAERSVFLALPPGRLGYDALAEALAPRLPGGPLVIVGESFSGPLALRLAAGRDVVALVLGASFVAPPLPIPAWLPRRVGGCVLRVPPPGGALRTWLVGPDASPALVASMRALLRQADPDAMAWRLAASLEEDACHRLRDLAAPVIYLRPRQDRLVPRAAWERVHTIRPDAVCVEVDGPHLVFQAKPAEAWAVLRAAVRRHGAVPAG